MSDFNPILTVTNAKKKILLIKKTNKQKNPTTLTYLEYKTHPNQMTKLTILCASIAWGFPRKAGLQPGEKLIKLNIF